MNFKKLEKVRTASGWNAFLSYGRPLPYMRYRVFDVHVLRFYADIYIFSFIEYPITLRKMKTKIEMKMSE